MTFSGKNIYSKQFLGNAYYGDGSGVNRTTLLWGIEVDWDEDGHFDGQNEAPFTSKLVIRRGRFNYIKSGRDGFEEPIAGECSITLDNSTGRYDPWSVSSSLYPNVEPGERKFVRIRVKNGDAGDWKNVFMGILKDIKVSGNDNKPTVTLSCRDGWSLLRGISAYAQIQTSVAVEDAMDTVLDYLAWPTMFGRNLRASGETVPYWWANRSGAVELEDLANSVLGYFFISADGMAKFQPRSYVGSPTITITDDIILRDYALPLPWETRVNEVRVKIHPREQQSLSAIWTLTGDAISVLAGESEDIWVDYTYSNDPVPATNIVQPVAVTDFTANSEAGGIGSDLTSSFTITAYDFGQTAKLTITNGSVTDGFVTAAQLRGYPIAEVGRGSYVASNATTFKRELNLDLEWQQSFITARAFADALLTFLDQSLPFPIVQLEDRPDEQFAIDLIDTAYVNLSSQGIEDSFRVGGIEHESLIDTLQAFRTKIYLEPYINPANYWIWPTKFGETSIFGF